MHLCDQTSQTDVERQKMQNNHTEYERLAIKIDQTREILRRRRRRSRYIGWAFSMLVASMAFTFLWTQAVLVNTVAA